MNFSIYPVLAALLDYPEPELLVALDEVDGTLARFPAAQEALQPLLALLKAHPLIELQENYVATFDRNPAHSLHLFEHVHGESRDRGQAMVDLLDEYRRLGLDMATNELPDHVPLFLEVLGAIEPEEARSTKPSTSSRQ
jgi:nitrate reductase delta subunit